MCGRNSLFPPAADLEARFDARLVLERYTPRYNIAPGTSQPIVRHDVREELQGLTWGFEAPWEPDGSRLLINARSESADERGAFAEAWRERPCLVPSSGFYEWQDRRDGPAQPYRIHHPDDAVFAMAGLWTPGTDGPCFTILTTEPNDTVDTVHDRMPVVLSRDAEAQWLDAGPDERGSLCRPYPDEDLVATPIGRRVNDPANDGPTVIEPVTDPQSGLDRFT